MNTHGCFSILISCFNKLKEYGVEYTMKLNLKLLSIRFSQAKDEPPVPTDGVNEYLLEKILLPNINNKYVYLRDIDFEAFDMDDINVLERYYDELSKAGWKLQQLIGTVRNVPPEARKARVFC